MAVKRYGVLDWVRDGWNAFRNRDQNLYTQSDLGPGYAWRPDRMPLSFGSERTIIASIITRISIDGSSGRFVHAMMDDDGRYIGDCDTYLNDCLSTEANIDQTAAAFFQDLISSLCDEGVIAVAPESTTKNPNLTDSYDIKGLRVCRIKEWFPEHVRVEMYDKRDGRRRDIILPKRFVAIIQNPLYNVMNEPNSTLQRLKSKLSLLDIADSKVSSSKMDLIFHVPYGAKTEVQRAFMRRRRREIEDQLEDSKYGIVYADASEKVTQLNRPIENHLLEHVEFLTSTLYSQLGITNGVLDGTASEEAMAYYYARTVDPIDMAICQEFNRKFLSKTARTRHQRIMFFRDPFSIASLKSIVAASKDLTSSAVVTPNEMRQKMGMKPSDDEGADELKNRYVDSGSEPSSSASENQNETPKTTTSEKKGRL